MTEHRTILPILYPSGITPTPNRTNLFTKYYRVTKHLTHPTLIQPTSKLLKQYFPMIGRHNGLYSKNTTIQPTLMITKSTHRGSNHRLNSPCSHIIQTRRLRYTKNYHHTKLINQLHSIYIPNTIPLRHNHNKLNLFMPNGP